MFWTALLTVAALSFVACGDDSGTSLR